MLINIACSWKTIIISTVLLKTFINKMIFFLWKIHTCKEYNEWLQARDWTVDKDLPLHNLPHHKNSSYTFRVHWWAQKIATLLPMGVNPKPNLLWKKNTITNIIVSWTMVKAPAVKLPLLYHNQHKCQNFEKVNILIC